jgi:tetratricopeptide (TPR) repeat protein
MFSRVPVPDALAKARAAVDRALAIDSLLPASLGDRAYLRALHDYRWAEAERDLERALTLGGQVEQPYAALLAIQRRYDEAIRMARRAVQLDPQSPTVLQALSGTLLLARHHEEALAIARRVTAVQPFNLNAWANLINAGMRLDRVDDVIEGVEGIQRATRAQSVTGEEMREAWARGGKPALFRLLVARWPADVRPTPTVPDDRGG